MMFRYILSTFLVLGFLSSAAFSMENEPLIDNAIVDNLSKMVESIPEIQRLLSSGADEKTIKEVMLSHPEVIKLLSPSTLSTILDMPEEHASKTMKGLSLKDLHSATETTKASWVPDDVINRNDLLKLLAAQFKQGDVLIDQDPSNNLVAPHESYRLNFGHTRYRRTLLQNECLDRICQLYSCSENSTCPSALDVASGEGVMTGYMMIAGAQVLAVDQNKTAIDKTRKTIIAMKKFLPPNKKEGRGKVSHYNALQSSNAIYIENHYDIVWCSNFLQFVDKEHLPDFIKSLFLTTKPGGTVYIQTEAPTGKKLYDTYRENQEKGIPFPGFGIYNVQGVYKSTGATTGDFHNLTATSPAQMTLVSHDSNGIAPGNRKAGFYGKPLRGPKGVMPNMSDPSTALYPCENNQYVGRYHVVYHLLDRRALSNALKNAGFFIQDAYYSDCLVKSNEITKFFEREHPDTTVLTCIVAQKPLEQSMSQSASSPAG